MSDILNTGIKNGLVLLCEKVSGDKPINISAIVGAGSNRNYFRIECADRNFIGVYGKNKRENRAFILLDKFFFKSGINVPFLYGENESGELYILQDLGDISLFDLIGSGEFEHYASIALDSLVDIQTLPYESWKNYVFEPAFGSAQVINDLNYFKYCFLKVADIEFDEQLLQHDFDRIVSGVDDMDERFLGFMYRDCQSRNIMVKDGEIWWIDFQGGRKGPALYDVVSFLWQAKANLSDDLRQRLLQRYLKRYSEKRGVSESKLLEYLPLMKLIRFLQVMGAYGLRGLVERKAHFLDSISGGLKNLEKLMDDGTLDEYPEIKRIVGRLLSDKRFIRENHSGLRIEVCSFSYKKGYPENFTGNGGGFMFDCRGMHNPGRYDQYKRLTGMDKPVADFLEERGEAAGFIRKAFELVSATASRYIERGFSDLQIGFGCTGGQHRSVYCAENVAKLLHERFPQAKIVVRHREQCVEKELS